MRIRFLVVAMAFLVGMHFEGLALAQQPLGPNEIFQQKLDKAKVMNFEGTVLGHDVTCHCAVVKGDKGITDITTLQDDYAKFEGDYDRAKGLKIGSKVSGTYKTVDYINYALEFRGGK